MNILYLTNNSADKKEEILDFLFLHHNNIQIYTRKINLEFIISNKVDFILSDRYGHVIPEDVITYLKDQVINTHPSYLPLNKGWQPNFFSIFNNNQCGVTIHHVDSGIDTGSIILQKKLTFSDNDTLRTSPI
jgi:methionyl-tRNA formyltransferase